MTEKFAASARSSSTVRNPHRALKDRIRGQPGQGLVELSLVLIVLLLLVAGAADFGRMYFIHLTMRDAAQEGASYGSTDPSNTAAIVNHVSEAVGQTIDAGALTITTGPTFPGFYCAGIVPATMESNGVWVTVEYDMPIGVPFIGTIVGSNFLPLSVTVENTILYPQCP